MAAGKYAVDGDQFMQISGKLFEIERQVRLGLKGKNRSPFNPGTWDNTLQMVVEGKWWSESDSSFRKWPVSYQIEIGQPWHSFVADLEQFCGELTESEENLLSQISFNSCWLPQTVNLVVATVAELELGKVYPTYSAICKAGLSLGLGLCPWEVPPLLRMEIKQQQPGWEHCLNFAMNPMHRTDVPDQQAKGFYLCGGNPPTLCVTEGNVFDRRCGDSVQWVFICHEALSLHQ